MKSTFLKTGNDCHANVYQQSGKTKIVQSHPCATPKFGFDTGICEFKRFEGN